MKRRGLVFFVVAMVLLGACSAQMANAQNANVAQKIIGTWVDNYNGATWVFNANGTLTQTNSEDPAVEIKFAVTDTKLATVDPASEGFYDISISSDGKTLILTYLDDGDNRGIWLTKK